MLGYREAKLCHWEATLNHWGNYSWGVTLLTGMLCHWEGKLGLWEAMLGLGGNSFWYGTLYIGRLGNWKTILGHWENYFGSKARPLEEFLWGRDTPY